MRDINGSRGLAFSLALLIAAGTAWAAPPAAPAPAAGQKGGSKDAAKPEAKAPPRSVASWKESLDLAADGTAKVTIELVLSNWDSDAIDLPLSYAKPEGVSVSAPDLAAAAAVGKIGDARAIKVKFDKVPQPSQRLTISLTAKDAQDWKKARTPRGSYSFSYALANTAPTNVGDFSVRIAVPAGYRMEQVLSSTPKATGSEVKPPYDFTVEEGRLAVYLRSPSIGVGKSAAISFNLRGERGSPWGMILAAAAVSLLALYAKRGVLTDPDYEREIVA